MGEGEPLALPGMEDEFDDFGYVPASPAAEWDQGAAKRALDELFTLTRQYRSGEAFRDMLRFVAGFRFYAPYNAMLVHTQMPGAKYVASPRWWLQRYGRRIKAGARPLVILQPMGPVMFVFDVSDTEPTKYAPPLPAEIESPFEVRAACEADSLPMVIQNARRDGIRVAVSRDGSQSAGSIRTVPPDIEVYQGFPSDEHPRATQVWVAYDLLYSSGLSMAAAYATVAHELAHLYCGHLGTPDSRWWPDRRGLDLGTCEFEAEAVAWLVCSRAGIDNPSEKYLSGYVGQRAQVPAISLDCVMRAAGLIEKMGQGLLRPRKARKSDGTE